VTRGGPRGSGPGGAGTNGGANGDGSTRGGGGAKTEADGGTSRVMFVLPLSVERPGPGMKMGDDDLFLVIFLHPWRSVQSPSRNFWSFKMW